MKNAEAEEDNYEHILVSEEKEDTNLFDEMCANFETVNDDVVIRVNIENNTE